MSEELKPCPNPKCQHSEPEVFDESMEAYVFCPKCFTRGPEFSICTNRRLYAEEGWESLPRYSDSDALRAELARKNELIKRLEALVEAHDTYLLVADDVAEIRLECVVTNPIPPELKEKFQVAYDSREADRARIAEVRGEGSAS